ncbi:Leucine-rich repeat (LRR) family protein isoform 2 [Hibiscus syriacus]|uniref:Leucine-rich repeat (LRR) family protein isoform 2 n=1 Tax=Hibiscus syriacus TaxID=106335 RepID=A0A6A2WHC6_HIBSY|nr:Leucine-rich repeat (LRR) family protein isoform 2 [Hibiscus syriacus]
MDSERYKEHDGAEGVENGLSRRRDGRLCTPGSATILVAAAIFRRGQSSPVPSSAIIELSPILTNLLDLTRLDMHNNKLTGPIPPQIGRLKHLRMLCMYLSFNNLKGEIPKELATLTELRYLHLHQNRYLGHMQAELGSLNKLQFLDVGNNHVVSTIKQLISIDGCFPALRNMYLNNNYLTGGTPAQLANLTDLEILYLSHNKLSGETPSEVARLRALMSL